MFKFLLLRKYDNQEKLHFLVFLGFGFMEKGWGFWSRAAILVFLISYFLNAGQVFHNFFYLLCLDSAAGANRERTT